MNEARNKYEAKIIKNEAPSCDETNMEVFIDEPEIDTCKSKSADMGVDGEHCQQFDNTVESSSNHSIDDTGLISDVIVDERDFETVFCEAIASDCVTNRHKVISVKPITELLEQNASVPGAKKYPTQKTTRKSGGNRCRKRLSNTLDANIDCEPSEKSFRTDKRYEMEHHPPDTSRKLSPAKFNGS